MFSPRNYSKLSEEERRERFTVCCNERRAIVEGYGLPYTPISLPALFLFGSMFDLCCGHFEPENGNLRGNLRAMHTDEEEGLLSDVWDLVRNVTGHDHFDKHVVLTNRRCWAAHHESVGRSTFAQPQKNK